MKEIETFKLCADFFGQGISAPVRPLSHLPADHTWRSQLRPKKVQMREEKRSMVSENESSNESRAEEGPHKLTLSADPLCFLK